MDKEYFKKYEPVYTPIAKVEKSKAPAAGTVAAVTMIHTLAQ